MNKEEGRKKNGKRYASKKAFGKAPPHSRSAVASRYAFREADKLEADLVAGRTTRDQLIKEGRLFTSVEALLADLNS